jgi:hypothetical protein
MIEDLLTKLATPVLRFVILYGISLLGAALMSIFSMNKGFPGSISFLRAVFPQKSKRFYLLLDFILVTIFGSFVGTILFNPNTAFQAFCAGIGWIGALNVVASRASGDQEPPAPPEIK